MVRCWKWLFDEYENIESITNCSSVQFFLSTLQPSLLYAKSSIFPLLQFLFSTSLFSPSLTCLLTLITCFHSAVSFALFNLSLICNLSYLQSPLSMESSSFCLLFVTFSLKECHTRYRLASIHDSFWLKWSSQIFLISPKLYGKMWLQSSYSYLLLLLA